MKETLTGRDLGLTVISGRLLTVKEVACFLRVSERWIQYRMKDGTFPFAWHLIGERDRLVDSAILDDWLRETRIQAGTALLPAKAVKECLKEEVIA